MLFYPTTVDYAVLMLSTFQSNDAWSVVRLFTNEVGDHGAGDNSNYITIDGNDFFSTYQYGWLGQSFFSNLSHPYKPSDYPESYNCNYPNNAKWYPTRLAFYFFPKRNNSNFGFPNLGISYGVFGRFGQHQGYIFSDDEDQENSDNDKNCSNYQGNNNFLFNSYGTAVNSCIEEVGGNTRLYTSMVSGCALP